jgi:hypothetical protein
LSRQTGRGSAAGSDCEFGSCFAKARLTSVLGVSLLVCERPSEHASSVRFGCGRIAVFRCVVLSAEIPDRSGLPPFAELSFELVTAR